jgi:hypothetical protein
VKEFLAGVAAVLLIVVVGFLAGFYSAKLIDRGRRKKL